MTEDKTLVPSASDIQAASAALRGVVVETPLVSAPALAEATGAASVLVKLETFQKTGSFKFRGAYWRCTQLSEAERAAGVVAYSSGNFAQGLAAAAQALGVPATIVMPIDAPETKRRKTEAFGAKIVQTEHGDRPREEVASETAKAIARDDGMTLLHPFDDPGIIAGHSSIAAEVAAACEAQGSPLPGKVVTCVGGGGLLAGLAVGFNALSPDIQVVPVEPVGYDSFGQSVRAGEIVTLAGGAPTICDALQATAPGRAPFACAQAVGVGEPIAVSDEEVRAAMRLAFETLKIVTEPSGAVPLAAVLQQAARFKGQTVLVMASGANIAPERFWECVGASAA